MKAPPIIRSIEFILSPSLTEHGIRIARDGTDHRVLDRISLFIDDAAADRAAFHNDKIHAVNIGIVDSEALRLPRPRALSDIWLGNFQIRVECTGRDIADVIASITARYGGQFAGLPL